MVERNTAGIPPIYRAQSFSSNHTGGLNLVYCDGSTHFGSDSGLGSSDPNQANPMWLRLTGIADGGVINSSDL